MNYPIIIPSEQLETLSVGGLNGRALRLPAPSNTSRDILLVYGHHPSLERMYSTAQYFNDFGSVYLVDFPGFGGMDSFYKIGQQPSFDAYADYLYAQVKDYLPGKKLSVVAMSFGFEIVTRMLQKYPDMQDRVELLVSFVGFLRPSDYRFSPRYMRNTVRVSRLLATRLGTALLKLSVFNRFSLHLMLSLFFKVNPKMKDVPATDRQAVRSMEVDLWTKNDLRTHCATIAMMFNDDLTKLGRVNLPVYNIVTASDQYFVGERVAEGMRAVYSQYTELPANMKAHAPSILGSKEEVAAMMPAAIEQLLKS